MAAQRFQEKEGAQRKQTVNQGVPRFKIEGILMTLGSILCSITADLYIVQRCDHVKHAQIGWSHTAARMI